MVLPPPIFSENIQYLLLVTEDSGRVVAELHQISDEVAAERRRRRAQSRLSCCRIALSYCSVQIYHRNRRDLCYGRSHPVVDGLRVASYFAHKPSEATRSSFLVAAVVEDTQLVAPRAPGSAGFPPVPTESGGCWDL
ncbi:hypothetical protein VIGAN_03090400 [Vigna angularis var. angularis]|uniref:Uncharacterized protein n=1 Tax=Vigna angularis var. angularis TaxID=157739 RepID=A0A0S3RKW1_PHAAN|nr:hypothetical protein VIGAN_03090400 [Vigna angularis var. angularis]